ncbi:hypothetical protein Taro_025698 [Colocasia esculenta]|uniref:EF-hand domain-containing protein n=1 Tax=Colocasia esculenta TaxID=4460 RepID=A0A843VP25_COLES|nr:hypothetical protein [Colocasia esculenta]
MASPLESTARGHGDHVGVKGRSPISLGNMDELERVFRHFDANGDGKISASELAGVVRSLAGDAVSDEEIRRMIEEMDVDRDGFVDLAEFAAFHRRDRGGKDGEGDWEGELLEAFQMYDVDGDGLISPGELQQVLRKLGDDYSVGDCSRMIGSMDGDGDGGVSFEEFKKMMAGSKNGDRSHQPNQEKEDLVASRVLFPFGCEGRPGEISRVWLFPSGVKEDQLCWVL